MPPSPRRTVFQIAVRDGGTEPRTGYVLGPYATHKNPGKGVYCWDFTHLATGLKLSSPWCETRSVALAHLRELHQHGPGDLEIYAIEQYRQYQAKKGR